jgi:hypothetical protein
MSMATDNGRKAEALQGLSGPVFDYIASVSQAALTTVLSALVKHGDAASLSAALSAGHARVDPVARAIEMLALTSPSALASRSDWSIQARGEFLQAWLVDAADGNGPAFAGHILESLDGTDDPQMDAYLTSLACLRPDFHVMTPVSQADLLRDHFGDCFGGALRASLIARNTAVGNLNMALKLSGTPLEHFPITMALQTSDEATVRSMTLAEHLVVSSGSATATWATVVPSLGDADSDAWYELGDLVIRMVEAFSPTPGTTPNLGDPLGHMWRLQGSTSLSGKAAFLAQIVAIIGQGAQFREPSSAWQRLANEWCPGPPFDKEMGPVPIWAGALYVGQFDLSEDDAARMLVRMTEEGGLSPDAEFDGSTLLQIAVKNRRPTVVAALLNLGADTRRCGSKCSALPIELAQMKRFDEIAAIIAAHGARAAMKAAGKPDIGSSFTTSAKRT